MLLTATYTAWVEITVTYTAVASGGTIGPSLSATNGRHGRRHAR